MRPAVSPEASEPAPSLRLLHHRPEVGGSAVVPELIGVHRRPDGLNTAALNVQQPGGQDASVPVAENRPGIAIHRARK